MFIINLLSWKGIFLIQVLFFIHTGSQASAPAHGGPDAGGGRPRCADAQEQVPVIEPRHATEHRRIPKTRVPRHHRRSHLQPRHFHARSRHSTACPLRGDRRQPDAQEGKSTHLFVSSFLCIQVPCIHICLSLLHAPASIFGCHAF